MTAHLLRRAGDAVVREALLFQTDFGSGFAPVVFRDWLPRDLRRRVKPGEWIYDLFSKWTSAWESVRTDDPRASFVASVKALGPEFDGAMADRGFVIYRPAGGVPA